MGNLAGALKALPPEQRIEFCESRVKSVREIVKRYGHSDPVGCMDMVSIIVEDAIRRAGDGR